MTGAADEEELASEKEEETGVAAEGKKKKRNKKKKSGAASAEGNAEEAGEPAAAPPAAAGAIAAAASAASAPNKEDDGEEEDEGEEVGAAAGAGKKKKRGKKKKAMTAGKDDETFGKWVVDTFETTKNCSETMSLEERIKMPVEFNGYTFSGALRPAYVTPQVRMPDEIMRPDYALHPDGFPTSEFERKKSMEVPILEGESLKTMREACVLGREVLDIAGRFMKAGVTGDEIDRVVYQACVDRKIYPSPLNYVRFPKTVCVSPNEVICHGIPDCRPIEEGDIVNLDISIYHKGFHADLNETFFIGECDEDTHRLVKTAYNALYAASKEIRPGMFYRDLGNFIHNEAAKNACSVVTTYCGHGVGELFHGPPKVPHYRKNKAVGIMKPGHVFTVEPMINLGNLGGDKKWPDNWTAVTMDGKRSAQFEHTFLVTETGVEVLTRRPGTDPKSMPAYDPAMFQV